jgi:hypothetical protein
MKTTHFHFLNIEKDGNTIRVDITDVISSPEMETLLEALFSFPIHDERGGNKIGDARVWLSGGAVIS